MRLSITQKILILFLLTLVVGGLGVFFRDTPGILITTMTVVLLNFSLGVKMLYAALNELEDIVAIVRKISYGDYNVVIDHQANEEFEALDIMRRKLKDRDVNLSHRAYQTAVLKEISERMSSSLDITDALEVIAGSLEKILQYSTVSYLTFEKKDRLVFKCHLEDSVSKTFVEEVKQKMLDTLKLIATISPKEEQIKTTYFGTIFDESVRDPIRSFFNLPLVVEGKVVGIINVASIKPNLYREEETGTLYSVVEQAGSTITRIKNLIGGETVKIRSMLASISEGLIMVGTEGEMIIINTKAKEILGFQNKEDATILDVLAALYGVFDFRGAMDQVIAANESKSFSEILISATYYKISASPVRDAHGDLRAVVFVFSDITREKEIDKMKSEFISTTSHQLRTPLSSMKWFLEMLLNKDLGELQEKQRGVLTDIYNSNERIIALVNDLLDVSRIESGKVILEPTPTNLIEFIKSMLPEVKQQFTKREQQFDFTYTEGLPRITIDPKLIWQVLQNLLTNASKYTPEKGKVALALSLENESVVIKVVDNGFGIPEFQKHRIFEKFFRADNIAKEEGTGLGLYIAKEIAEASGGKLWFESAEGKGTTFFFTLPLSGSKPNKIV